MNVQSYILLLSADVIKINWESISRFLNSIWIVFLASFQAFGILFVPVLMIFFYIEALKYLYLPDRTNIVAIVADLFRKTMILFIVYLYLVMMIVFF